MPTLVEYYFDIETTGLDPQRNKVITIQTQRLVGRTGKPIDKMEILKEWESSEKEIIKDIIPKLTSKNPFDFIIVGKDLLFDFMFLSKRAEKYDMNGIDLLCVNNRVFTDIKHVLVLMNKGNFRGYDKLLNRGKIVNVQIPRLYKLKRYDEIIEYIKTKAMVFVNAYQRLREEMPSLVRLL